MFITGYVSRSSLLDRENSSQIYLFFIKACLACWKKKFKPIDLSGLMTREAHLRNWFNIQVAGVF